MDLIQQLKEEENMGVILITHDMAVVAENCDRVIVMYLGHIVEEAPKDELIHHPKSLLVSVPNMNPRERKYRSIRKAETDTG